jgi:hypothetical protein
MKQPRTILAALLAGAAASWMVPSPAWAGAEAPTIKVTAKPATEHFVDNGAPGDSPGDQIIFTERLFQHGERVGRDAVQCVEKTVTRHSLTLQCLGTLIFRGRGQITIQGALTFSETGSSDETLAVTGGTREFRGASGEFRIVDRPGPDRYLIFLDNPPV